MKRFETSGVHFDVYTYSIIQMKERPMSKDNDYASSFDILNYWTNYWCNYSIDVILGAQILCSVKFCNIEGNQTSKSSTIKDPASPWKMSVLVQSTSWYQSKQIGELITTSDALNNIGYKKCQNITKTHLKSNSQRMKLKIKHIFCFFLYMFFFWFHFLCVSQFIFMPFSSFIVCILNCARCV